MLNEKKSTDECKEKDINNPQSLSPQRTSFHFGYLPLAFFLCMLIHKKFFFLDEMGLCYYILVICIFNE